MPYFPVDDDLHSHPKVDVAGLAAMGLWTLAGSWSKKAVTGGFVPTARIVKLGGTKALTAKLVAAGFWVTVTGGIQFHDWDHQAGNFDADTERARREAERARNRVRKQAQRARESHAGHGVTLPVTPADVTSGNRTPPVPVPLTKDTHISPVPNRESYPQATDDESLDELCARQLASLGVEYTKVKTAIGRTCGRIPDPTAVVTIVTTILGRATQPIKSPTRLVLAAISTDWAEWQQLLDERTTI